MRRLMFLILVLTGMMFVFSNNSKAVESGILNNDIIWELDDNGVLTITGEGSLETIPDIDKEQIEKVIIGEGITSLPPAAFYNCTFLQEAVLPETLEIIGSDAFYKCVLLSTVNIPSQVNEIGMNTFRECASLTFCDIGGQK